MQYRVLDKNRGVHSIRIASTNDNESLQLQGFVFLCSVFPHKRNRVEKDSTITSR